MEDHTEEAKEAEEVARLPVRHPVLRCEAFIHVDATQVKIAIWASLLANFCLCVLQRTFLFTRLFLATSS